MDAGGDKEQRSGARGTKGEAEGRAAPPDEAWGPHAVAESEGDSGPEYALIPVEEDGEVGRAREQTQGREKEQEQEQEREQQEALEPAVVVGDKAGKGPSGEVEAAAACSPDSPTATPAAEAPDTADPAVVSQDPSADVGIEEPEDAGVASSAARPARVRQQQEEAIELSLALSDSSVEPPTGEAAEERVNGDKSSCSPLATGAETGAAVQPNGTSMPLPTDSRRKRKRTKRASYSSRPRGAALARLKLEGAKPPPVAVYPEQSDHAHGKKRHVDPAQMAAAGASPGQESTFLYPSTPTGTAWQWDSCEMYFAPIRQENLDDLERIRKSQANFVAANPQLSLGVQAERAQLDAMVSDASDRSSARVHLDQRRGRYYRDVWEEEDFVAAARRRLEDEEAVVPEVVQSNRDLVFGYDDDLFRDYVARLESVVATTVANVKKNSEATPTPQPEEKAPEPKRTATNGRRSKQTSKRGKKAARPSSKQVEHVERSPLDDVFPVLPCHEFHPASLGWWKLVKDKHVKQPSFSVVHPASMNRDHVPVRWIEEAEANRNRVQEEQEERDIDDASDTTGDASDNANGINGAESEAKARFAEVASVISDAQELAPLQLPSFGDAGLEQDEISRAIATSAAKLMPLSMANWRILQTVYERAACAQQCASIFDAEAAVKKSLEHLYASMFAPPREQQPAVDSHAGSSTAGVVMGRDRQPVALSTRPRDLVAFSSRSSLAGDDASVAVAASVEFAMSLQMGDIVDALDHRGCWNDGVVLEVFAEGGRYPKFVLVRLSLWSHEVVEWVGVAEGRLLPRGVAGGKMEFVLSRSQFRGKKLTLTRQIAHVLEQSFPQRRARLAAAAQREAKFRARRMEDGKASQKRKRKRAASASTVV